MFITKWFYNIKTAINNDIKACKAFGVLYDAKNKICFLESIYDMPNAELEQAIGKELCEVKYCPEDWLGSLLEDDPETISKHCPYFTNTHKCIKSECPVLGKNHSYASAAESHDAAKAEHIKSVKRIFGIRTK